MWKSTENANITKKRIPGALEHESDGQLAASEGGDGGGEAAACEEHGLGPAQVRPHAAGGLQDLGEHVRPLRRAHHLAQFYYLDNTHKHLFYCLAMASV